MHTGNILRMLALLSLLLSLFMIPCATVAAFSGEYEVLFSFIKSIAVMLPPSSLILLLTRKSHMEKLSVRDGFFFVFLAWFSISLFASLPFYLSGSLPTWADAFFEASSGISTTGATVMNDIDTAPASILLWRSITHWIGGMGIVMLSVALLPLLGIGGMQLVRAETSGVDDKKMTPRITQTAKYLWLIYTGFTAAVFLLMKLGGMDTFSAVNHAFSSIASGGFSTKNASLGYYGSAYFDWVAIGAMCVAGISFALYYKLFTGNIKAVFHNTELKAYLTIIIAAGFIIALINYRHGVYTDPNTCIRYSFFQVVSFASSTGYTTADYTLWPGLSQFILLGLFFIGGCAGSTAGGFKVIRIVILTKQTLIELRRLVHRRGVFRLRINGASVNKEIVYSVSGFLFLYLFSIIAVTGVAASADMDIVTAFSTGISLMGNIGPGFGDVGPATTYALYPGYVKWVLGVAMLVGRLEIYTFFILLTPYFWKRL